MKGPHWSISVMLWTGIPAILLLIIAVVTVFSPVVLFRNAGMILSVPVAATFTAALLCFSVKVWGGRDRVRPSKRKVRWTYFLGGPVLMVLSWLLFSVALIRGGGPIWNEMFADESKSITLDMTVVRYTGGRSACRKRLDTNEFRFSLVTDFCLDDIKEFRHISHVASVEIEYSETSLGILVKRWKLISGN